MAQFLPQAGPLYFLVATSCSHTARLASTAEELGQALETKINLKQTKKCSQSLSNPHINPGQSKCKLSGMKCKKSLLAFQIMAKYSNFSTT